MFTCLFVIKNRFKDFVEISFFGIFLCEKFNSQCLIPGKFRVFELYSIHLEPIHLNILRTMDFNVQHWNFNLRGLLMREILWLRSRLRENFHFYLCLPFPVFQKYKTLVLLAIDDCVICHLAPFIYRSNGLSNKFFLELLLI